MTQYVDYEFYSNTYHGNMNEAEFSRQVSKATAKIKANTFGRVDETNIPEEVKYCACNLIDKMYIASKSEGKTSESVGPHSVSYANTTKESQEKEYGDLMREYLSELTTEDGVPLLYRGC